MSNVNQSDVLNVFRCLNSSGVDWLLLRNTGDELPNNLAEGKDIDILVRPDDRDRMITHLVSNSFYTIRHPYDEDIKLYGIHDFDMLKTDANLLLDINYEIACRSTDGGQWIPLDKEIQESVWCNRIVKSMAGEDISMPSDEDLFVTTLARCVFVKRSFTQWHRKKLSELFERVGLSGAAQKLPLVFFAYSQRLLNLIQGERYDEIVEDYLSFADY